MVSDDKEVRSSTSDGVDERRLLVSRIVASSTFSKSHRLSSLLTFICDLALQGRTDEINEQKIGAAVFGRKPHYDSSIDGIVRAQASRLRTRLELYFEEEGREEFTRIVIPRGGYIPHFLNQQTREIIPLGPESSPISSFEDALKDPETMDSGQITLKRPEKEKRLWVLLLLLATVILVMGALRARRVKNADSQASQSTFNPLWKQLFVKDQQTLLIFGDSGLVMYQAAVGRNLGLAEYLNGSYRDDVPGKANGAPIKTSDLSNRRYTSVVDLEILRAFDRISEKENARVEAQYARDVRPNDLKQGNVILVGATEANPWVELFERNMNFGYSYDRVHRIYSVTNRNPQGNEPRQWDSAITDKQHRVFGVVAYLPNLSGTGSALILEGTGMAGTESAWDFASDESQLLPFLDRIRRSDGSFPHFEVVLGTNNMRGSAVKGTTLAWRTFN
jgi:hypothetical protein